MMYVSGSRTPFQFPSKRLPPEKVYRRMSDQDDSVLERIACKFRSVLKSLKEKEKYDENHLVHLVPGLQPGNEMNT